MQTPHNGPTMRVCLDGVLSSEVYYRAHRCGRRRFFYFFNRQPVTLFEFYCSFLRVGTGLEMEAEFTNPELKGGVTVCWWQTETRIQYAIGSRALVVSAQIHWQTQHSVLVLAACSKSFCHVVWKDCSSTCNNKHINSGFTTKSLYSSVGLNATWKHLQMNRKPQRP